MRKKAAFALICALVLLAGASAALPGVKTKTGGKNVVEIRERLFIAQTNDIYLNPEDYRGKIIKYEGIFKATDDEETKKKYSYVFRYGPGCCALDGFAGFEVVWDQGYPQDDAWVEVTGAVEEYTEDGADYVRLRLTSLTVLKKRGKEYVAH